jgi:predicted nuclease of predicted toxin-antitoxin system
LLKPKLLADENIPRSTVNTLGGRGYDILSLWDLKPGMSDEEVVDLAIRESRMTPSPPLKVRFAQL